MRSWKTTLVGCVGAVANALFPLLSTGSVPTETLIMSAVMALLGFVAKDFNVTGGPPVGSRQ
jgi:hypothetical protein